MNGNKEFLSGTLNTLILALLKENGLKNYNLREEYYDHFTTEYEKLLDTGLSGTEALEEVSTLISTLN